MSANSAERGSSTEWLSILRGNWEEEWRKARPPAPGSLLSALRSAFLLLRIDLVSLSPPTHGAVSCHYSDIRDRSRRKEYVWKGVLAGFKALKGIKREGIRKDRGTGTLNTLYPFEKKAEFLFTATPEWTVDSKEQFKRQACFFSRVGFPKRGRLRSPRGGKNEETFLSVLCTWPKVILLWSRFRYGYSKPFTPSPHPLSLLVEGCFSLAPEALSSVRRRRKWPLWSSFSLTDIVQDLG